MSLTQSSHGCSGTRAWSEAAKSGRQSPLRRKILCGVGKELYLEGRWHQPDGFASIQKFANGAASSLSVVERPAIHVHADKFIGEDRIHVTRELHRVVECRIAVLQSVRNTVTNYARHLQPKLCSERAANRIGAERQRQLRGFLPPLAEIHYAVQADLREKQLALVNQQARLHFFGLHGVKNLVERHRDYFDVGFEELQSQIGSCQRAGNRDFASREVSLFNWVR